MYKTIILDHHQHIATLTLNRPAKLNAYTPAMGDEIVEAFQELENNDDTRVIILTGAGKGFCAGVDLDELKKLQSGGSSQDKGKDKDKGNTKLGQEHFVQRFAEQLFAFPKPVIAAINGAAVGVGTTMTLPCDIRLAAHGAKLGLPFTKLGIIPGLGSSYLLPRLVGLAKAKELVYSSDLISAAEAADIGLINRCIDSDQLMPAAIEMAEKMASYAPATMAAAKQALNYGATSSSLSDAVSNEHAISAELRKQRR